MRQLLAAIRFLTILPLPGTWGTAEDDLARSVAFFPLVGLLLGAAAAAVAWGLALVAPSMVTAAVLVIVLLGFSGGLHIDGLSDTADGFSSCRSREQMLEIMKDSRAGPMGLVAVVCVLLLKFAALSSIALLQPAVLWPAVLLMPLAGRSAVCINLAILPSARPDGLGAVFCRSRHHWAALGAVAVLAAATWVVLGLPGLIVSGACLVVALLLAAYVYRKLGGATGDTLGAVCEIVEIVPPLALTLWPLGLLR